MPLSETRQPNALGQAVWVGTFSIGLLCLCKELTDILVFVEATLCIKFLPQQKMAPPL